MCIKLRRKHLLPLKLPVVGVNLSLLSLISISATIVGYVTEQSAWKETAGDQLQWEPCVLEERYLPRCVYHVFPKDAAIRREWI